jgi:hypothetical protein
MLAQALFRRELFGYVKSYMRQGNPALAEYRDKSSPVSLADEFRSLLDASFASSRDLNAMAEFRGYLERYPETPPPNLERFLYWDKLHLAFRPVIAISDVVIDHRPEQILIGSKQIYASHYLEGSLGLIAALDGMDASRRPGMYLVYVNRSHIDALDGAFAAIRRAIVQRRLREAFRRDLTYVAASLESSCGIPKG